MTDSISSNRSAFKEFIASISTISGDLSNITAPPFLLAQNSTVELPQYWADHPQLFVAPTFEQDPAQRALLVLKWFLGSLRNQQYAGRSEDEGVKKPLNAFLGELLLGSFKDNDIGETRLLSEQVSHHPPVTACYLWNDQCGIRAEGFTCQEITFSGSVSIKQKGFAVLHIDKFDENYLVPLPDVKVKGVLSGTPYPELTGTVHLVSSTGYVAEISFEGKGFLRGSKNSVDARLFKVDMPEDPLYHVHGQWTSDLTIHDVKANKDVETYNVTAENSAKMSLAPLSEQDPWESRRAWEGVIASLQKGNMQGVSDAKSKVEQGQRQMREDEKGSGREWTPVFFTRADNVPVFDQLQTVWDTKTPIEPKGGMWRIDKEKVESAKRPFHGDMTPGNQRRGRSGDTVNGSQKSSSTAAPGEAAQQKQTKASPALNRSSDKEDSKAPPTNRELDTKQVETFLRNKYSSVR
ncbi:Oxysterol-binding protein [Pseudovirgaria hyperparasitica]|uniref:Oxysterol-binding protein n=1 Tax=Pseudovirgaria hyperparasitica TaxID=470096 RepID=A0A6A6W9Q4_9PEZI|nr:Oxysterol-binding protein [Pseudovirgaria hyperparasitica]KAF2758680.1 Oxysterol-binding protein [Pseudovirgaria hyperparasitica]